jgi:hypothetical protein
MKKARGGTRERTTGLHKESPTVWYEFSPIFATTIAEVIQKGAKTEAEGGI